MHLSKNVLLESIDKLDQWITRNNWKAYDPFDGLSADMLSILTFNNHYLRIALQQTVRRFPVNLRPLIGIKKATSSKGMAFCALGYLKMHQATQNNIYIEKAQICLDWLINNYSKGYSGYSWGNHFSYEARGGRIPLGVPTIVWTSLIANVFLDAFEYLDDQKYLNVAKSAADFVVHDIGRYEEADDCLCFMYTPQDRDNPTYEGSIHNSNVLGAWLLARVAKHINDNGLKSLAKKSINYTITYQLPDGGWYYGEANKFRWIDSFHTGYVLESIHGYIQATGDKTHEDKLLKGYKYFIKTFFETDGTPRYYNYKIYPIDIQCPSQGIQTLVNLRQYDPSSIETAEKIAQWTIKHMQDEEGFFYFRKYPAITNKTPMFHWGQATMLSGLAHLYKSTKNGKR